MVYAGLLRRIWLTHRRQGIRPGPICLDVACMALSFCFKKLALKSRCDNRIVINGQRGNAPQKPGGAGGDSPLLVRLLTAVTNGVRLEHLLLQYGKPSQLFWPCLRLSCLAMLCAFCFFACSATREDGAVEKGPHTRYNRSRWLLPC